MPEYGEVKLMSQFADRSLRGRSVLSIKKNPISKMRFDPPQLTGPSDVSVLSRGKESRINILQTIGSGKTGIYILVNYGMSGSWKLSETQWQKHAMISLELDNNTFLEFIDPRRFGVFKYIKSGNFWSENRGADPVEEYGKFYTTILLNQDHKDFENLICEVLMNQYWFNGVGNYLRSTILEELKINPFKKFNTLNPTEIKMLCFLVKYWCKRAYELGGAQLSTWKNPDDKPQSLTDVIFYKKGLACKDKTGRTFWFEEKWVHHCPYEIIKNKKTLSLV